MNSETLLSPELAVQTSPDGSMATALGLLIEPKPAVGDDGAVCPETISVRPLPVFLFTIQAVVPLVATADA
jgi:hypothetical protein